MSDREWEPPEDIAARQQALRDACLACDGKGYNWYPNGGPHGIGNRAKCKKCNGKGRIGGDDG